MVKVEEAAFERVVGTVLDRIINDNPVLEKWAHKIALRRANLTEYELRVLGDTDEGSEDPRYKLYYAELSNLTMVAVNAALAKMTRPW